MEQTPTVLSNTVSTSLNSITNLSSLSNNANIVGSAWMISSAVFTTYSTTAFLQYRHSSAGGSKKKDALSPPPPPTTTTAAEISSSSTSSSPLPKYKLFPDRPSLLTFYRFSGSLLLGLLLPPQQLFTRLSTLPTVLPPFILPATFLFIANYSNSIALDRIGISLTYTSKCGIPLVTLLLSILMDGKSAIPSPSTLLSLVPIAFGIGAASWNAPQFEAVGFGAAVVSCVGQSALTVSSKRVMKRLGVGGLEAQRVMVAVALVYTFGTALVRVVGRSCLGVVDEETGLRGGDERKVDCGGVPWKMSALAVLSYHVEYCLSFIFTNLVEPITFGTCDAIRRLMIIIVGRKIFGGKSFTPLNLVGMACALAGALMYAIVSAN